jgi:hypothetical protein
MSRMIRIASLALLLALSVAPAMALPQEFVIIFGTDQSDLTREAQQIVTLIAAQAREKHPATIAVSGYGDSDTGQDAALAENRADAVTRALVAAGISADTLKRVPPLPPEKATGIPVHKVTVTFDPEPR